MTARLLSQLVVSSAVFTLACSGTTTAVDAGFGGGTGGGGGSVATGGGSGGGGGSVATGGGSGGGSSVGGGSGGGGGSSVGGGSGGGGGGAQVGVGSDGGVVSAFGATVTVPAGALTTVVNIEVGTVSSPPAALPAGFDKASDIFALTPHGTTFATPVTVVMPITKTAATVLRLEGSNDTTWEPVSGAVLTSSTATFTVTSFSYFVAGTVPAAAGQVEPFFSNAPNWNSWILKDTVDGYLSSNAACTAASSSNNVRHSECLHGGEMRKVAPPGQTSCTGLTATDTLNAFDWSCRMISTQAVMVSRLKDSVPLATLIDFSSQQWKLNAVTVSNGSSVIHTTQPARWWTNTIVVDDDGGTISAAGSVVLIRVGQHLSYYAGAANLTFVVEPGVTAGPPNNQSGGGLVQSNQFATWIEGDFVGNGAASRAGPYLQPGSAQGVLRHVRMRNVGEHAIVLQGAKRARIEHAWVECEVTGAIGISIKEGADGALVRNVRASRCATGLATSSGMGVFENIHVSNNGGIGVMLDGYNNVSTRVTAVHNEAGIRVGFNGIVMHAAAVNNSGGGIAGDGFIVGRRAHILQASSILNRHAGFDTNGPHARYRDVASFFNTKYGFRYDATATPKSSYEGTLIAGYNGGRTGSYWPTQACYVNTFQPGDCYGAGAGEQLRSLTLAGASAEYACELGNGTTAQNNAMTPVVGQQFPFPMRVIADSANASEGQDGKAAFASVADWRNFQTPFRNWGADGSAIPNCDAQGACETGKVCQVWEYSLRDADNILRDPTNLKPTGNETDTHDFNADGAQFYGTFDAAQCAQLYPGGTTMADPVFSGTMCRATFLRRASEVLNDGIGNDNLLCESNEVCLYAPNKASYQGHGPLVNVTGFTNGTLSNISLVQHETNGVSDSFRP